MSLLLRLLFPTGWLKALEALAFNVRLPMIVVTRDPIAKEFTEETAIGLIYSIKVGREVEEEVEKALKVCSEMESLL